MSRIGKKPIPLPKGVTVKIEGNTVAVQGPKGKLDTQIPAGIKVEQQDGHLVAVRENDSQAALHGLTRALVNNAVEGVTRGWTRDLEIVGIGYRAESRCAAHTRGTRDAIRAPHSRSRPHYYCRTLGKCE